MPNSLKYPFSTPMKSTADDVSLRAPSLIFCTGWAPPGPVASTSTASATTVTTRLMGRFLLVSRLGCPRQRHALAADEQPGRGAAHHREQPGAHHPPAV